MGFFSTGVLAGMLIAGGVGTAAGWLVRKMGEDARMQAHEAECREYVKAAGKARDRAREEASQIESRLHRLREEHRQCAKTADGLRSSVAEMTEQARERASSFPSLQEENEAQRREIESLKEQGRRSGTELTTRKRQLKERTAASESFSSELDAVRSAHAGCAAAIDSLKRRIAELEAQVRERDKALSDGAPAWLLDAPDGGKDDLQAIRGLGPVLERDLNRLGIFHYRQLARMTAEDIDWIATRIKVFPGRIKKAKWAEQASQMRPRSAKKPSHNHR